MIVNFKDNAAEDIFNGLRSKQALKYPQTIWSTVQRKLDMLNAAHALSDLSCPPGNRLERLKGRLKGFHSVRINDQFRIVFRWSENNASDVQITDYH